MVAVEGYTKKQLKKLFGGKAKREAALADTKTPAKAVQSPCDKNQIRNPETGRCVLIDGVIGSKILGVNSSKTPPRTESKNAFSNKQPKIPNKKSVIRLPRILFDPETYGKSQTTKGIAFATSNENRPNVFGMQSNVQDALVPWLTKQAQYIAKLNMDDFLTISAYANDSDKWLGKYQSNEETKPPKRYYQTYLGGGSVPFVVPLYPQIRKLVDSGKIPAKKLTRPLKLMGDKDLKSDIKIFMDKTKPEKQRYEAFAEISQNLSGFAYQSGLKEYELDLQRIVMQAPPTEKKLTLFRGAKKLYMKMNKPTIVKQFSSTAYSTWQPLHFGTEGFHRIELPPGSRALAMSIVNPWNDGGEDEILLPMNSEYVPKMSHPAKRWVLPNIVTGTAPLRASEIKKVETATNFIVKTPK